MKIKDLIILINKFIILDIWRLSHKGFTPLQAFLIKEIKIFIIAIRGFKENKVIIRASALTYFTLLSVVPIVAMAFGIAKGFGFEKVLEKELLSRAEGQEDVFNYIISFAHSMLERTKGGVVAGVGLVMLFWSIMQVLGNIEKSFNDIWQVKKGRPFFRKFSDYLSIMLIAPVFILLSSSVTVYITTHIAAITKSIALLGYFSPVLTFLVKLIPYVLIWILFSFLYVIMPNTKVKISSGIIAGILAGTLFQLTQWAYFKFQIGVSNYNAIYGSFAALPLFMIYLQTGWLIVLFGAEVSFASQNYAKYEFENEVASISPRYRRILALVIVQFIVKRFAQGDPPANTNEISHNLQIPSRIAREVLNLLCEANIIEELTGDESTETAYLPAIDINQISIMFVIDRIDNTGISNLNIAQVITMDKIENTITDFYKMLHNNQQNVLLKDI